MNILIKYFSKLSNLGIRSDMTYFDKYLFRSINKGVIFIVLVILLSALFNVLIQGFIPFIALLLVPIGSIALILNYYEKHDWTKFYLLSILPFIVVIFYLLWGMSSGMHYLILIFVVGTMASYANNAIRFWTILYQVVLFGAAAYYNSTHTNLLEHKIFSGLDIIMGVVSFLILILALYSYQVIQFKQADELAMKNKDLVHQNNELQLSIEQNNIKTKLLSVLTHDLRGSAYTFSNLTKKINFLIQKNFFFLTRKYFWVSFGRRLKIFK